MKSNTKSSITLPPEEVLMVEKLQKRLKMKTKVAVIRQGLHLLNEHSEREVLKEKFRIAAQAVRAETDRALEEMDSLTSEGLDEV